jgi:hypothetical protein
MEMFMTTNVMIIFNAKLLNFEPKLPLGKEDMR